MTQNKLFSKYELYWLNIIKRDVSILDKLDDSKDIYLAESFINFIRSILKYNNLNTEYNLEPNKRLIKLNNSSVSLEFLNFNKCNYIMFNGIFIEVNAIFFEPDIVDKWYNEPTNENKIKLGLPSTIHHTGIHKIFDYNNRKFVGVGIIDSPVVSEYLQYESSWEYPIF